MRQIPVRRLAGVIVVALTLAAALPAAALPINPTAFAVVLKDGSVVAASTRPLIAMGKVSFLDGTSRTCTLPVAAVDLAATRAGLDRAAVQHSRVWTATSMQEVHGHIQIVGESEAASGSDSDGSSAPGSATTAQEIRDQIAQLDAQIKPLDPRDRRRAVLMIRQAELRQELERVTTPVSQRS